MEKKSYSNVNLIPASDLKSDNIMIEDLEIVHLVFITYGLSGLAKTKLEPTAGLWFINGFRSLDHFST